MSYRIVIEKKAQKFISKLPEPDKKRVIKAISVLPQGNDIKRLQGSNYSDYYRLRVGGYRIIYTKDDNKLIICIITAGNRGQIYNNI